LQEDRTTSCNKKEERIVQEGFEGVDDGRRTFVVGNDFQSLRMGSRIGFSSQSASSFE